VSNFAFKLNLWSSSAVGKNKTLTTPSFFFNSQIFTILFCECSVISRQLGQHPPDSTVLGFISFHFIGCRADTKLTSQDAVEQILNKNSKAREETEAVFMLSCLTKRQRNSHLGLCQCEPISHELNRLLAAMRLYLVPADGNVAKSRVMANCLQMALSPSSESIWTW
jgi:hypothetical protein